MTYAVYCPHCDEYVDLGGNLHKYDFKRLIECPNCSKLFTVEAKISFIVKKITTIKAKPK